MKDCKNCGKKDSMYLTHDGPKCYDCGWIPERNTDLCNEHPTREVDSQCGDIVSAKFNGVSRAATRKAMCVDGTMCTITPSGIKEEGDNHVVTCTIHKET